VVYLCETKIDAKLTSIKGLSQIYGVGKAQSERILHSLGIQKGTPFGLIPKNEITRLKKIIERELNVSSRLRQETSSNIQNLVKIRCYRGSRHRNRLPVRGQRTSTNARTQKKHRKS
jgi:small subunit ribosomal protein S13